MFGFRSVSSCGQAHGRKTQSAVSGNKHSQRRHTWEQEGQGAEGRKSKEGKGQRARAQKEESCLGGSVKAGKSAGVQGHYGDGGALHVQGGKEATDVQPDHLHLHRAHNTPSWERGSVVQKRSGCSSRQGCGLAGPSFIDSHVTTISTARWNDPH